MSTPSPEPTTSTISAGNGLPNFVIPSGTSSSTSSVFGSGAWLAQPVDITGWPSASITAAIVAALKADNVDPTGQVTGEQLAKAVAELSKGDASQRQVVSQIQQMLWYAGAYPSSVKSFTDLQPGVFSDQDTKALRAMITSAQQTGIPFGTYLGQSANYGQANGTLQALQGTTSSVIQPPNPISESAALRPAAQRIIGEDPTPQQLAAFQAYYTQVWLDGNKKAALAQQQGVDSALPDAATLAQAITDQKNPPNPPTTSALQGGQQALLARAGDAQAGTEATPQAAQFNQQMTNDRTALSQVNAAGDQLQATGGLKAVTAPPDLSNAAEDWLTQNDQAQVQAHNLSNVMDALQVLTVGAAKVYGRDTFQQNRN